MFEISFLSLSSSTLVVSNTKLFFYIILVCAIFCKLQLTLVYYYYQICQWLLQISSNIKYSFILFSITNSHHILYYFNHGTSAVP